eukprot:TRINITY_DN1440_c0_g1_i1.p1 TRINITY_DN1440_c0_g1~~TRINITY_DN1440_c0_g1_i1.p1  ORF type:complete len:190 (+),score=56.01 TRINITY_DN1440_c0_g1_i1:442-1011(+)
MRTLLSRISREHLRSFWPIILTELIKIFDLSKDTQLLLAATKFLDIGLILPSEQFHLYQWMFLADCLNCPDEKMPMFQPYIDQVVNTDHLSHSNTKIQLNMASLDGRSALRQPLITVCPQAVDSLDALKLYMCHYSQYAYLSSISGLAPDMKLIDLLLSFDLCEWGNTSSDVSKEQPAIPSSTEELYFM